MIRWVADIEFGIRRRRFLVLSGILRIWMVMSCLLNGQGPHNQVSKVVLVATYLLLIHLVHQATWRHSKAKA
jgi:hypothetical protein